MEIRQAQQDFNERLTCLAPLQQHIHQTPPATPIPADIYNTASSLKKAKQDIQRYLN